MDYDLRGELGRLTDEPVEGENDLPLTEIAHRVRRNRTVRTTAVTLVGAAAAVAIGFGIQAVGPWQGEPVPPARPIGTLDPQPTPTPEATPEPEPTPEPPPDPDPEPEETADETPEPAPSPTDEPFSPELAACGSTVVPTEYAGMWVGNYGGGVEAEADTPMTLVWSVIIDEDWSDRQVTATVEDLWLLTGPEEEEEERYFVAAVPAEELPDPFVLPFRSGSEGGGGGSEATIELTLPFISCATETGDLAEDFYGGSVQVTLDDGTRTWTARGEVGVHVGGWEVGPLPS